MKMLRTRGMSQLPMFASHKSLPSGVQGAFQCFWDAYPPRRPNPRARAELLFASVVRSGAHPEDLVRAAGLYAAECKARGTAEDFIVHAATFLRQARWLDYQAHPEVVAAKALPTSEHLLWPLTQGRISPADFNAWLAKLNVEQLKIGRSALVVAPSKFHRDWVRSHYIDLLRVALNVDDLRIEVRADIAP